MGGNQLLGFPQGIPCIYATTTAQRWSITGPVECVSHSLSRSGLFGQPQAQATYFRNLWHSPIN